MFRKARRKEARLDRDGPSQGGPDMARRRHEPIGHRFRRVREAQGHSLQEVADVLRIRPGLLEAIELGRFGDLPGDIYGVGFVRSYAQFLELDPQEAVAAFRAEIGADKPDPALNFPVAKRERSLPVGGLLLVGLVLAAGSFTAWHYRAVIDGITQVADLSGDRAPAAPTVGSPAPDVAGPTTRQTVAVAPADAPTPAAATPAQLAAQVPPQAAESGAAEADLAAAAEADLTRPIIPMQPPAPDTTGRSIAGLSDGGVDVYEGPELVLPEELEVGPDLTTAEPAAGIPAPPAAATGEAESAMVPPEARADDEPTAPTAEAQTQIAALQPAQEPSPTQAQAHSISAVETQPPRIVIRAEYDSWVQISKRDDGLLLARLLRAGESFDVPNTAGLTMDSGNIGALRLVVDGEALQPLGPLGGVVRGMALDPEKLKSGAVASR